jgi:phosphohistidine phosphatase
MVLCFYELRFIWLYSTKKLIFDLMKRLYLIRHGEALDTVPGTDDSKRKLSRTGITETKKVIKYLSAQQVTFDFMIASHAIRTIETAKLIAKGIEFPLDKIVCDKRIYFEEFPVFFDILSELDNTVSSVAMIGHNPEISVFASHFLENVKIKMTPSTVIGIEILSDDWVNIKQANCKKIFIVSP